MSKSREVMSWSIIIITIVIFIFMTLVLKNLNEKLTMNTYNVEKEYINNHETKFENNELFYVLEVDNGDHDNIEIYNSNKVELYNIDFAGDTYIEKHLNYYGKVIKVSIYNLF